MSLCVSKLNKLYVLYYLRVLRNKPIVEAAVSIEKVVTEVPLYTKFGVGTYYATTSCRV